MDEAVDLQGRRLVELSVSPYCSLRTRPEERIEESAPTPAEGGLSRWRCRTTGHLPPAIYGPGVGVQ